MFPTNPEYFVECFKINKVRLNAGRKPCVIVICVSWNHRLCRSSSNYSICTDTNVYMYIAVDNDERWQTSRLHWHSHLHAYCSWQRQTLRWRDSRCKLRPFKALSECETLWANLTMSPGLQCFYMYFISITYKRQVELTPTSPLATNI